MPLHPQIPAYQETLNADGNTLAVGTHTFGPFEMANFSGILIDATRDDDGSSGTATMLLKQWSDAAGAQQSILDGAGNAVAINDWAAGENVRRQLQVHPMGGPMASSDVDGVFTVGTTGVASTYYRQPMPPTFYVVVAVATDIFEGPIALMFLN